MSSARCSLSIVLLLIRHASDRWIRLQDPALPASLFSTTLFKMLINKRSRRASTSMINPFAEQYPMPRPPSTMANPFNTTSSIFGNEGPSAPQTVSSLFGGGQQQQQQQQQQQPASNMFGAAQQQQPASNVFGATQQQQPASNVFGSIQQQQPAANSIMGNQQQQQPGGGLFGASQQQAQQQPAGASLFGGGQQQPMLGQSQQQQQQPGSSLWQPGQGMVPRAS